MIPDLFETVKDIANIQCSIFFRMLLHSYYAHLYYYMQIRDKLI